MNELIGRSHYPDSRRGALQLLSDELGPDGAFERSPGVRTLQDPHVPGAWAVRVPGLGDFIVYVGNHPLAPDCERVEFEDDPFAQA